MSALPDNAQLTPPTSRARWFTWVAAIVLPCAIVGFELVGLHLDGKSLLAADDGVLKAQLTALATGLAICCAVAFVIDRLMARHRLELGDTGLKIATTFYGPLFALDELKLQEARVVNLDERPEYRSIFKTNGVSMPGFHSGWFRLRSKRKAFVARTGGKRVLVVPTTRDLDLVLEPRNPQALLDALRGRAPQGGRRRR